MSQMLAPYNNSMRLGQGFNSYTQQICLDKAVLQDPLYKPPVKKGTKIPTAPKSSAQSLESSLDHGVKAIADGDTDEDGTTSLGKGSTGNDSEDEESQGVEIFPWVKPQIVTYSSRFVDKLSDVTDAMNISGSLSIKTATIGGKANGSYVDSDKFKSSDINFHLQVKVTNQIHDAVDFNKFNKIAVDETKIKEVYGDTFISGWEEGGELNAIISMKIADKAKIHEIKASLEAEMTTPSISGYIKGKFEKTKNDITKDTETTIAVNWSGGGSIKHPTEDWSIGTLKKAAAAFPDLVAVTPQRTYAILTKYTSLVSFHEQVKSFSPLDYENAGIYTGALLDHYMDYKSLWKQISHSTYELEGGRATIDMAQPTEDIIALAVTKNLPKKESDNKLSRMIADLAANSADEMQMTTTTGNALEKKKEDETGTDTMKYSVFQPSFAGLIRARQVCRFEMTKIVHEVDLVAKSPELSSDPYRDAYFLNPLVFKQLLPVVRSLTPENAILGVKDPHATLILGYNQPQTEDRTQPPVYKLEEDIKDHNLALQESIQGVRHKARNYRMEGCAGNVKDVHSQAHVFNDLITLDPTFRPATISVWSSDDTVRGIQITYASSDKKQTQHGVCTGTASHSLTLAKDGSEVIVEVVVIESVEANTPGATPVISSIAFATSACNILDTSIPVDGIEKTTATDESKSTSGAAPTEKTTSTAAMDPTKPPEATGKSTESETPKAEDSPKLSSSNRQYNRHTWTKPDESQWSLRGFFGFIHGSSIINLGIIWGKDSFVPVPSARISTPLCKNFLGLSNGLQSNIRSIKTLSKSSFLENFMLGTSISTLSTTTNIIGGMGAATGAASKLSHFNALGEIDVNWTIKTLAFASKNNMLAGIKVIYHNGKELSHGFYTTSTEVWRCEVKSDLVVVKITAGALSESGQTFIDTLEFVRADLDGNSPAWPLDLSTLRYLGEGNVRVSKGIREVVESAPRMGNAKWSVKGFYGECADGGIITRFGVVWGRK